MNLVLAFIAFNFIVIVHELGHFIAAKKFGIRVIEFSLFVGPRIFSIKRGETTYSLRLFPVIAYVKMEGEDEASESEASFNKKPRYARAIVAAAAPAANLLVAAVILTVVFSLTGYSTTTVGGVDSDSPAYKAGIREGDRIISYDGKRIFITPMDVMQLLYLNEGKPSEIVLLRDNTRIKTTIAPRKIPEHTRYQMGFAVPGATGADSNLVKQVYPDTPAEKAGLKPEDRIIRLNETEISEYAQIVRFLEENREQPVKVTVLRDGSEVSLAVTPVGTVVSEQYEIGMDFMFQKGNIPGAFKQSVVYTISLIRSVWYSLVMLITGKAGLNQMMGPIGIVSTIGSVVQQSPTVSAQILNLFWITAMFSIAVGATQFIPFPMMDGNKLLLIAIEAVRRKPIPPEKEAFISMVGFVMLILLAVYAAYNDILRLVGAG